MRGVTLGVQEHGTQLLTELGDTHALISLDLARCASDLRPIATSCMWAALSLSGRCWCTRTCPPPSPLDLLASNPVDILITRSILRHGHECRQDDRIALQTGLCGALRNTSSDRTTRRLLNVLLTALMSSPVSNAQGIASALHKSVMLSI